MDMLTRNPADLQITPEEIEQRRSHPEPTEKVLFRVAGLYGYTDKSAAMPVSRTEAIESGPVTITLDPVADPLHNMGMIDFERRYLRVRYGIHAVFPGIHELVMSGKHDLSLLGPVRAIATDECKVTEDLQGWQALGCLDFLPGSIWSAAGGG